MTKKRILQAAKALFAQNGYDGTSISDVLKKTDLSKGALYYHFKSKEDLFLETLMFAFEEKGMNTECETSQITSKVKFKKHLLETGLQIIEFQKQHPQVMVLKWELLMQMKKNPALKKKAQKISDTKMNNMVSLMEQGIKLGVFPKNSDTQVLLLQYILPIQTIGIQIAVNDQKLDYCAYWKKIVGSIQ